MTDQPFFSGNQCGARFLWRFFTIYNDYTDQVASISGLSRTIDFNGNLQHPQITITLGGSGLVSEGVGDLCFVTLREVSSGQEILLAQLTIKTVDVTETNSSKLTVITGVDVTESIIPSDYNYYQSSATDPRKMIVDWLYNASSITCTAPAYTDNYQREQARVAAPASTLAGLAGVTDVAPSTSIRAGDERDPDYWGPESPWITVNNVAPATDIQWTACPGLPDNRSCLGKQPLYFHQRNMTLNFRWTGRIGIPATSTDRGQFPMGCVQYLWLSVQASGGTDLQGWLGMSRHTLTPTDTQDVEITFKSRKEAKEFYRRNAAKLAPGPDYGWGRATYTSGPQSEIKRWGGARTVTITNVSKYTGTLAPFYSQSKAVLASGATTLDFAPAESVDFGEFFILGSANSDVNYNNQSFIGSFTAQFVPQRMDAGWQAVGINGANTLMPGYQIQQTLHPITINQDYTTRALVQQACVLGDVGMFTGGGAEPVNLVDTCPESGQVFALALTIYNVASVDNANQYPMPQGYDITVKTPDNVDYTCSVNDSSGTGANMTINIMQGSVQGWQQPTSSGGNKYLSLSSTNWQDNPGGLIDRWTGSRVNSAGNIQGFNALSSPLADRGACVIDGSGVVYNWTTNISNYTGVTKYAIRGADGVQKRLFCSVANVGVSNPPDGNINSAPYIDGFPLFSMLKAHARAFSDNYNRQSWRLKTTFAFAPLAPGDVVAVQLPQIFGGQKCLALVVSVELSTDSFPDVEIVPMHIITSDDYNNFTNLGDVI